MGIRRFARRLSFSFLFLALTGGVAQAACAHDTLWLRGEFGTARFAVAVADTGAERSQGLMNVEKMAMAQGMLFVYPRPQSVAFWMKNTLIPLDILFADERGVVQKVHANAIPQDLTPIPGGDNIQYVLEINGGLAASLGLAPGVEMRHPSIMQDKSAWPCDAN